MSKHIARFAPITGVALCHVLGCLPRARRTTASPRGSVSRLGTRPTSPAALLLPSAIGLLARAEPVRPAAARRTTPFAVRPADRELVLRRRSSGALRAGPEFDRAVSRPGVVSRVAHDAAARSEGLTLMPPTYVWILPSGRGDPHQPGPSLAAPALASLPRVANRYRTISAKRRPRRSYSRSASPLPAITATLRPSIARRASSSSTKSSMPLPIPRSRRRGATDSEYSSA
jgi:hypothetical protein